ncbi:GroES-like protein [Rhizodiscina lignyota]|uniref:GroES-like protein n=1 Tax=Rhizodiscina lignyota TaxID=1504668 RepID=A0A9P4IKP3_9PEZI|nr:GroES-like protein [Rhizodiscina lignyota]
MDAVIFRGPYDIAVEKRPKPSIQSPTDAIVRVIVAGICGSELHMYRGHQKTDTGHIMGHEMVGIVEEVGSEVSNVKPGDRVVSTFSAVCMSCWYCKHSYTNRCIHGSAFGTQQLDGSQAEFVRIPFADGTLEIAPLSMPNELLVMMCDIFPTGYYGASRATEAFATLDNRTIGLMNGGPQQNIGDAVFVCIGCGPVGLCAILTARSKGVRTLFAIDAVDDRLEEAKNMGAIPLKLGKDDIKQTILEATDGRGADAVIEVVGNKAALRSAFDLLRPCGVLSSIGFHQGEFPFDALESYQKNLNVNFGRAPVRAVFRESLECLDSNKEKLKSFISHKLPISEAPRAYALFEKQEARKVILVPGR